MNRIQNLEILLEVDLFLIEDLLAVHHHLNLDRHKYCVEELYKDFKKAVLRTHYVESKQFDSLYKKLDEHLKGLNK